MVAFDFSTHKVLMVDSDAQSIARVREIYNYKGLTNFEGMSSTDMALDLMGDMNPGLTLLGLGLGAESIEFLKKIRNFPGGRFSNHPVVVMIPSGQVKYVREACEIGIEGALRKPFEPVKLLKITRASLTFPKRFTDFDKYFGKSKILAQQKAKASAKEVMQAVASKKHAIKIDVKATVDDHRLWINSGRKEGKPCRLANAIFVELDLAAVDLTLAQMPGGNFSKMDCSGSTFRKTNLKKANFSGANLTECDFSVAHLEGANFSRAKLKFANMRGSNLENANMFGAHLMHCDLGAANLKGVNLVEANLSTVKGIFREQLAYAQIDSSTKLPLNIKNL
ncbi:MAG: pentapeptide repeat-containing protein [Alphaproteobacteria bacterium]|nr:pentapeptide repeat-containing protein [Rhodospirillales bacterium]MCW9045102.1 pentapeptide repeat-containing protein [Alphaproteobacteria bacterium]